MEGPGTEDEASGHKSTWRHAQWAHDDMMTITGHAALTLQRWEGCQHPTPAQLTASIAATHPSGRKRQVLHGPGQPQGLCTPRPEALPEASINHPRWGPSATTMLHPVAPGGRTGGLRAGQCVGITHLSPGWAQNPGQALAFSQGGRLQQAGALAAPKTH